MVFSTAYLYTPRGVVSFQRREEEGARGGREQEKREGKYIFPLPNFAMGAIVESKAVAVILPN